MNIFILKENLLSMGTNYLLNMDVVKNSPLIMGIVLFIIIFSNISDSGKMIRLVKKLLKKALIVYVAYFVVTFILNKWFLGNELLFSVETWIYFLSLAMNGYLIYLFYLFIKKSNKTVQKWYYLLPIITLLGSRLLTSILNNL